MPRTGRRLNDDFLLEEIRRVAAQPDVSPLTCIKFAQLSGRASVSVVRMRFGSWKKALAKAGVVHLYSGLPAAEKMKTARGKDLSSSDLIEEMRRIHAVVGSPRLRSPDFNRHSTIATSLAIRSRFGTWVKALKVAGLLPVREKAPRLPTKEEAFENLIAVWIYLGRLPEREDLSAPPSTITAEFYELQWGSCRQALRKLNAWVHAVHYRDTLEPSSDLSRTAKRIGRERWLFGPRLQFQVAQRDGFRCAACGRGPATHPGTRLTMHQLKPVVGASLPPTSHLQTLCEDCKLS